MPIETQTGPTPDRTITLRAPRARARVYPELGFQLHAFDVTTHDDRALSLVQGPAPAGRAGAALEPPDRRYGNPVLFPNPGVCHGEQPDTWTHAGRALPMPQHGWARNAYWQVESLSAESVTGVLLPNSGLRAVYPFEFVLRMSYRLDGTALHLHAELHNVDARPLPWALGLHPYLRAPLCAGGRAEDCAVALPACTRLTSGDGWRTVQREPFEARTLSAGWPGLSGSLLVTDLPRPALTLRDAHADAAVEVAVQADGAPLDTWVLWSPRPDSGYLCIEPWSDPPNALGSGRARALAPGDRVRHHVRIGLVEPVPPVPPPPG